jgi:electron transport complex protein RnfC
LLGGEVTSVIVLDTETAPEVSPTSVSEQAGVRKMLERLTATDPAAEMERLSAAGVMADRWTSPNLAAQLAKAAQSPVHTVLCSALDLDPVLPMQHVLATTHAMDLAAGAAALGKLLVAKRVILAVPEDMPQEGVDALRKAAAATGVRLFPLLNEYPLGQTSVLIRRVTRCRLRPGRLPPEVGVLVIDAPAAVAIGRCFVHGESMLRVPLGIYDQQCQAAHLLWAPVGMKLAGVFPALNLANEISDFRTGHVLRETPVDPTEIVGGTELTVFAAQAGQAAAAVTCLRCGWCVEACPVQINPAGLLEAAQQNDRQLADDNGLQSCIECGICTHVCPARLPLLTAIRGLRADLLS